MKNKKAFLLGENFVKILIALISMVLIGLLLLAIYKFYVPDESAKVAQQQLESIYLELQTLSKTNPGPENYIALNTVKDWTLFSSEFGNLCSGNFCLCICKNIDCSQKSEDNQERACIATDKFISLKNINPENRKVQQVRAIVLENPPLELKLSFIDEEVYPYASSTELITPFEKGLQGKIPLFFKFNNEWLWSLDLQNWMPSATLTVSGGEFDGSSVSVPINIAIIEELQTIKNSQAEGEAYLRARNVKKSIGVYAIERV